MHAWVIWIRVLIAYTWSCTVLIYSASLMHWGNKVIPLLVVYRAFHDALCLWYNWQTTHLPSHCVCGQAFNIDQAQFLSYWRFSIFATVSLCNYQRAWKMEHVLMFPHEASRVINIKEPFSMSGFLILMPSPTIASSFHLPIAYIRIKKEGVWPKNPESWTWFFYSISVLNFQRHRQLSCTNVWPIYFPSRERNPILL